jgi:hypothetical protein
VRSVKDSGLDDFWDWFIEDIDEYVEDSMKKASRDVEVDPEQSAILRSPETQNLLAPVIFNQGMLFVHESLTDGNPQPLRIL